MRFASTNTRFSFYAANSSLSTECWLSPPGCKEFWGTMSTKGEREGPFAMEYLPQGAVSFGLGWIPTCRLRTERRAVEQTQSARMYCPCTSVSLPLPRSTVTRGV